MRRILHIDMDAFYASVEQRDRPELRGRPVAVGGWPESRGVVMTASYEARTFGVHSAMPMSRAVRLCPDLAIVPPDFRRYREASKLVLGLYREVTLLVEPLSLDEAYLDVTENAWGEPLGVEVAKKLKQRIRDVTSLTASAGVAPNKFLAKIASGWRKPDGLTVVAPERVEGFLQKLPVDALWGVGPVTAKRLRERGIERLVDVRTADPEVLRAAVGSMTEWLQKLARGEDDRPVEPNRPSKSSSSEITYNEDLTDLPRIREEIDVMAREMFCQLRPGTLGVDALLIRDRDDVNPLGPGEQRQRIRDRAGRRPAEIPGDRCRIERERLPTHARQQQHRAARSEHHRFRVPRPGQSILLDGHDGEIAQPCVVDQQSWQFGRQAAFQNAFFVDVALFGGGLKGGQQRLGLQP